MLVTEIAQYLSAQGVGVYDETGKTGNLFIAHIPATPDVCAALYPNGGPYSPSSQPYDDRTVQVWARSTQDPRPGEQLAQSIYDALHGFRGYLTPGGTYAVGCFGMQSGPTYCGMDENKRVEYSLNFQIRIYNPNRKS